MNNKHFPIETLDKSNATIAELKAYAMFWSYVNITTNPDECWEWQSALSQGYGRFYRFKRGFRAHRLAWLLTHGSIQKGVVLHKCDNPRCCNPNHLQDGTQKDNMQDMFRKKRGKSLVEYSPRRFTDMEARVIYERVQNGESRRSLAKESSVVPSVIGKLVKGITYKELELQRESVKEAGGVVNG